MRLLVGHSKAMGGSTDRYVTEELLPHLDPLHRRFMHLPTPAEAIARADEMAQDEGLFR